MADIMLWLHKLLSLEIELCRSYGIWSTTNLVFDTVTKSEVTTYWPHVRTEFSVRTANIRLNRYFYWFKTL